MRSDFEEYVARLTQHPGVERASANGTQFEKIIEHYLVKRPELARTRRRPQALIRAARTGNCD